jgi:hypothetical protein
LEIKSVWSSFQSCGRGISRHVTRGGGSNDCRLTQFDASIGV